MSKFHNGPNGPGICKAKKGNCPFGGADSHFESVEAAQAVYDKERAAEDGLLPGVDTVSPALLKQIKNVGKGDTVSVSYENGEKKFEGKVDSIYKDHEGLVIANKEGEFKHIKAYRIQDLEITDKSTAKERAKEEAYKNFYQETDNKIFERKLKEFTDVAADTLVDVPTDISFEDFAEGETLFVTVDDKVYGFTEADVNQMKSDTYDKENGFVEGQGIVKSLRDYSELEPKDGKQYKVAATQWSHEDYIDMQEMNENSTHVLECVSDTGEQVLLGFMQDGNVDDGTRVKNGYAIENFFTGNPVANLKSVRVVPLEEAEGRLFVSDR